jgi:hypothetical protein
MIQISEQDHARITAALDAAKIPPGTLAERVEAMAKGFDAATGSLVSLIELLEKREKEASHD